MAIFTMKKCFRQLRCPRVKWDQTRSGKQSVSEPLDPIVVAQNFPRIDPTKLRARNPPIRRNLIDRNCHLKLFRWFSQGVWCFKAIGLSRRLAFQGAWFIKASFPKLATDALNRNISREGASPMPPPERFSRAIWENPPTLGNGVLESDLLLI